MSQGISILASWQNNVQYARYIYHTSNLLFTSFDYQRVQVSIFSSSPAPVARTTMTRAFQKMFVVQSVSILSSYPEGADFIDMY